MKPRLLVLATVIALGVSSRSFAGEMKMELRVDGSDQRLLRQKFGMYGYRRQQALYPEPDGGLRFWLPAAEGTSQTGVYSLFALAGDCEVTLTYELLKLPPPKSGYGSGCGLGFDIGEGENTGRGDMQRVYRIGKESGYALHSHFNDPTQKKPLPPKENFVQTTAQVGRMSLRRVKKELIFLVADNLTDPLEEIDHMPFTDQTIRTVRFFADPGNGPNAVDVRLRQIEIRAEEITGGVAERDVPGWSPWWWLLLIPVLAGCAFLGWLCWRLVQLWIENRDEEPVRRQRPRVKKA